MAGLLVRLCVNILTWRSMARSLYTCPSQKLPLRHPNVALNVQSLYTPLNSVNVFAPLVSKV